MATVTGIDDLITSCWNRFQKVKTNPFVVQNSIPILWFGDMDAYFESGQRILTVALNPSDMEFKDKNHPVPSAPLRSKNASKYISHVSLSAADIQLYKDDMNNYFNFKPYTAWFSHYEKVLNVLDSSYYPNTRCKTLCGIRHDSPYKSIHVDLYSPAATDPNWSSLNSIQKQSIISCFNGLFSDLLNYLNPTVIIISVGRPIIDETFFDNAGGLPFSAPNAYRYYNYFSHTNKKGYIRVYELPTNQILICGRNWNSPFAMLNQNEIETQFKVIKNMFLLKAGTDITSLDI